MSSAEEGSLLLLATSDDFSKEGDLADGRPFSYPRAQMAVQPPSGLSNFNHKK